MDMCRYALYMELTGNGLGNNCPMRPNIVVGDA